MTSPAAGGDGTDHWGSGWTPDKANDNNAASAWSPTGTDASAW